MFICLELLPKTSVPSDKNVPLQGTKKYLWQQLCYIRFWSVGNFKNLQNKNFVQLLNHKSIVVSNDMTLFQFWTFCFLINCVTCFVHPIFPSFGFWYFGHFRNMIFFPVFFPSCPSCLENFNLILRNIFVFS